MQEIKDSGQRREFEGGAVRDIQKGKGRMDLLPAVAVIRLSKHFEAGADKYGEYNWQKGIPIHSYIDSAIRHLMKYLDGQDDEDHLCAAAWNCMCAMWTEEKRPDLQDIPSRMKKEEPEPNALSKAEIAGMDGTDTLNLADVMAPRLYPVKNHKFQDAYCGGRIGEPTIMKIRDDCAGTARPSEEPIIIGWESTVLPSDSPWIVEIPYGMSKEEATAKVRKAHRELVNKEYEAMSRMASKLKLEPIKVDVPYEKKPTNGDRIRAMSDKRLAEFLCDNLNCDSCPFGYREDIYGDSMCRVENHEIENLIEWLGKTEGRGKLF